MNSLVALTDFSPAADNAALYAARLAQVLGVELVLLNVYQLPVTMNDMPVLMVSAEELKNNSDAGLLRTKELLEREVPGVPVRIEGRMGDVNDELDHLSKDLSLFAAVVGTHHYKGIEKMLFGNTAFSVVKHCRYPVIVVPEAYKGSGIRRIVYATDLQPVSSDTIERIIGIVQRLRAELHLVHIDTDGEEDHAEAFLQAFQSLQPQFQAIRNDSVTEGLHEYIQRIGADLIIALPHKHNLLDTFIFKRHTKALVEQIDTPLLFIHE